MDRRGQRVLQGSEDPILAGLNGKLPSERSGLQGFHSGSRLSINIIITHLSLRPLDSK